MCAYPIYAKENHTDEEGYVSIKYLPLQKVIYLTLRPATDKVLIELYGERVYKMVKAYSLNTLDLSYDYVYKISNSFYKPLSIVTYTQHAEMLLEKLDYAD